MVYCRCLNERRSAKRFRLAEAEARLQAGWTGGCGIRARLCAGAGDGVLFLVGCAIESDEEEEVRGEDCTAGERGDGAAGAFAGVEKRREVVGD